VSVLMVTENFPPRVGGAGVYAAALCQRLGPGSVTVLTSEQAGAESHDAAYPQAVVRTEMAFDGWGKLGLAGWRRYRRLCDAVRGAVSSETRVMVANRLLPEGEAVRCVAGSMGLPYAVVVHGEELNTVGGSRELTWLARRVLGRADLVIANSRHTAGLLMGGWGVGARRLAIVTPGVDVGEVVPATPSERAALRAELGWGDGPVVLTAGRLQKRKGHDRMIEAWRGVAEVVPGARWVVVGDGPDGAGLREVARHRGLGETIEWAGQVDRAGLIDRYRACDLFVLPNRTVGGDFEGFGIVLLEAQAAGRPVLCGRSGGAPETQVEGVTGCSVDASSVSELAGGLIDLLGDRGRLEAMGRSARAHAESNHGWSRSVERFAAALSSLGAEGVVGDGRELDGPAGLRTAA